MIKDRLDLNFFLVCQSLPRRFQSSLYKTVKFAGVPSSPELDAPLRPSSRSASLSSPLHEIGSENFSLNVPKEQRRSASFSAPPPPIPTRSSSFSLTAPPVPRRSSSISNAASLTCNGGANVSSRLSQAPDLSSPNSTQSFLSSKSIIL